MNKREILRHLDDARRAHISWRMHALNMVSGLNVADKAPLHHEDCKFSRWYREEGLEACGHYESYHRLDAIHKDVHKAYQAIFDSAHSNQHSQTLQNMDRLTEISARLIEGINQLAHDIEKV